MSCVFNFSGNVFNISDNVFNFSDSVLNFSDSVFNSVGVHVKLLGPHQLYQCD